MSWTDGSSSHPMTVPRPIVSGGVDTDSRLIEPGGIFVAKPGEVTDGHLFVDAAVENGAAVAIVERVVAASVSQIVVADAIAALADLARHVVAQVRDAGDLRIVGITGSNGKTTTKNLLARILEDEGETVAPRASFNNEVGAPLTMLRVSRGHAVPGERVRRERAGRDRPARRTRGAGRRCRAHGRHGPRRRIRRNRGHVRGEVRTRARAASAAASPYSTPTTPASPRWRRSPRSTAPQCAGSVAVPLPTSAPTTSRSPPTEPAASSPPTVHPRRCTCASSASTTS